MNTLLRAALAALTSATVLSVASCASDELTPPTMQSTTPSASVKPYDSSMQLTPVKSSAETPASNSDEVPPSSIRMMDPSLVDPSPFQAGSSSKVDGVIFGPRPAGRSADDDSKIDSASDVLSNYWLLADQIGADPGQDWQSRIATVSEAQASDNLHATASSLAGSGEHTTGRTRVEVSVSDLEPALVTFVGCIDVSGTQVIDSSGKEIGLDDGPGQYLRFPATIQVGQYQDGRWRVSVLQMNRDATC